MIASAAQVDWQTQLSFVSVWVMLRGEWDCVEGWEVGFFPHVFSDMIKLHKMHCEELANVNFLLRTVLLFESIFELKKCKLQVGKSSVCLKSRIYA